jgi:hypothetical protein
MENTVECMHLLVNTVAAAVCLWASERAEFAQGSRQNHGWARNRLPVKTGAQPSGRTAVQRALVVFRMPSQVPLRYFAEPVWRCKGLCRLAVYQWTEKILYVASKNAAAHGRAVDVTHARCHGALHRLRLNPFAPVWGMSRCLRGARPYLALPMADRHNKAVHPGRWMRRCV